ncbi:MAG: DsbE family thiol:disulfide interchange protein [Gammaproteobacteria bacterium]
MNKFLLPLAAFVLLAVVLGIGIKRSPEKSVIASVLIGRPAPEFNLPSLTDPTTKVSTSALRGKPYVLNVWGTWCVECRAEHSSLLELQKLGEVPIIGLNWKDDEAQALSWLSELGNPYAQIAVDKEGRTAIDWGVYGAPESFLIDAKGIVIHKHVGAMTLEVWRRDFLPRLTGRAAGAT